MEMLLEGNVAYFYNPDGEWCVEEQRVELDVEGPTMESILNRRQFGTPCVSADVFTPWVLHSAIMLGTVGQCIAVQLAAWGLCLGHVEPGRSPFGAIYARCTHRKTAHHTNMWGSGGAAGSQKRWPRSVQGSKV